MEYAICDDIEFYLSSDIFNYLTSILDNIAKLFIMNQNAQAA